MNTYQKIELEDYTRSGEGGTAVSYTHKSRNTLEYTGQALQSRV